MQILSSADRLIYEASLLQHASECNGSYNKYNSITLVVVSNNHA